MSRSPAAIDAVMSPAFGNDWRFLPLREKDLVAADVDELLSDRRFPTWDHAVREYARRIGSGNLASYAACLVAGAARRATS